MVDWSIIQCENCGQRIEGCRGLHGHWMHENTRSEFCADGTTLAVPLTPQTLAERAAKRCLICNRPIPPRVEGRGRQPHRYCSTACSAEGRRRNQHDRYEEKAPSWRNGKPGWNERRA